MGCGGHGAMGCGGHGARTRRGSGVGGRGSGDGHLPSLSLSSLTLSLSPSLVLSLFPSLFLSLSISLPLSLPLSLSLSFSLSFSPSLPPLPLARSLAPCHPPFHQLFPPNYHLTSKSGNRVSSGSNAETRTWCTATAQSQHSHGTVTAQSRHSHGTVTVTARSVTAQSAETRTVARLLCVCDTRGCSEGEHTGVPTVITPSAST